MQPLYYKPSGSHPISELPPWNYTQIGMTTFEDKPCPHTGSSFLGCIGSFHGEVEKWNDDPPKWSKRLSNHIFTIWTSAKKPSQKVWTISKTIQGFPSWESSIQLAFDLKGEDRELMSQWATSKGKNTWLGYCFFQMNQRDILERNREIEREIGWERWTLWLVQTICLAANRGFREKKKHLSTRFVTQIISNYQTWRRDLVEEKSPPTMPLIIMCWSSVPSLSERFWLWDAPEEGPKKATPKETWQIWWEIGGLRDLKPDQVLFVLDGCKVCIWGRIRIEFQWLSNNLCTVN